MRRAIIIFVCFITFSQVQAQESKLQKAENRNPIIEVYADETAFENAFAATCGGTLFSESFNGGPGPNIMEVCGTVLSSAGDTCFPPGELEDGFNITVSNSNNFTAYYGEGFAGNTEPLVGDAAFPEITVINFPGNNISAVGSLIFNTGDNLTSYKIYGEGGVLLADYIFNEPPQTEYYFGFIADEIVTSIEIEGGNVTGNFIGELSFGNCPNLSLDDNIDLGISLYPNPIEEELNIVAPSDLELIEIFDITGKKVFSELIRNHSARLNLSKLQPGMYLLSASLEGVKITHNIVKK